MTATIADVTTTNPLTVDAAEPVRAAAELMRQADVGDVLVVDGDQLIGIATDRDIVVRVLAGGGGPDTPIREACSPQLVTIDATQTIDRAVDLMREHAIRRLPVISDSVLVGILSIGDLAKAVDPTSALADISAAEPTT